MSSAGMRAAASRAIIWARVPLAPAGRPQRFFEKIDQRGVVLRQHQLGAVAERGPREPIAVAKAPGLTGSGGAQRPPAVALASAHECEPRQELKLERLLGTKLTGPLSATRACSSSAAASSKASIDIARPAARCAAIAAAAVPPLAAPPAGGESPPPASRHHVPRAKSPGRGAAGALAGGRSRYTASRTSRWEKR